MLKKGRIITLFKILMKIHNLVVDLKQENPNKKKNHKQKMKNQILKKNPKGKKKETSMTKLKMQLKPLHLKKLK